MMDRIGYETTQTVHYFQIDGSRSMTPAALLSALQEMAISHSDSLGFSVQYNLTHHCFWSVVNWHLFCRFCASFVAVWQKAEL